MKINTEKKNNISNKQVIAVFIIFVIAIFMVLITPVKTHANFKLFDFKYDFDYAYISLPNGECIEGKVDNWRDYEDGDQLQIQINGVTYLTDTTRAVLVSH